mmetsp:Transcript_82370/g.143149  ORF Transcript_82370/g.143149 Transcript_82370/m.143149 type:complete len:82 (-) Transcript_82370:221-466(-)
MPGSGPQNSTPPVLRDLPALRRRHPGPGGPSRADGGGELRLRPAESSSIASLQIMTPLMLAPPPLQPSALQILKLRFRLQP